MLVNGQMERLGPGGSAGHSNPALRKDDVYKGYLVSNPFESTAMAKDFVATAAADGSTTP